MRQGRAKRSGIGGALFVVLALALVVPSALAAMSSAASAQERRTLFDLLFGRESQQTVPVQREPAPRSRPRQPAAASSSASEPQRPSDPPAVEKLENAHTLLVIGDFLGAGLAEGLAAAFAQSPGVRVASRTNGSSGFVREDFYDWGGAIDAILDEEQPAIVAVMIGSNDRQQISAGGDRHAVRTEPWLEEYEARVRNLANAIRARGLPLVWVGMPAFRAGSMSADMLAFNDIYRSVTEEAGGEFVDIWDGFVDENGAFAEVGPDINGQRARLRGSDGINMTAAGKRKMAFYAERPLNRILGDAASPEIAALPPGGLPPLAIEPAAPANIDRTQPIALGDPELDGGSALLGGEVFVPKPEEAARTPAELLVIEGKAAPAVPGRADDFSVRKPNPAPSPDHTETTAIPR